MSRRRLLPPQHALPPPDLFVLLQLQQRCLQHPHFLFIGADVWDFLPLQGGAGEHAHVCCKRIVSPVLLVRVVQLVAVHFLQLQLLHHFLLVFEETLEEAVVSVHLLDVSLLYGVDRLILLDDLLHVPIRVELLLQQRLVVRPRRKLLPQLQDRRPPSAPAGVIVF